MSGHTHSDKTTKKMSDSHKENDHSGRFQPGENHPNYGKKVEGSGNGMAPQAIEVVDLQEKTTTYYNSISEAAIALNTKQSIISNYFRQNQQKPYKGQYIFYKIKADII
jgi:hypothetical protein